MKRTRQNQIKSNIQDSESTVYAFNFIEEGRYQLAVFYHLKMYIKIETLI